MNKKHFIAIAITTALSSATSFANDASVYSEKPIVDTAKPVFEQAQTEPEAPTTQSKHKEVSFDATALDLKSTISIGYVIPDGFKKHAEDGEDGLGIKASLHIEDYRIQAHYDSFGVKIGDTTQDIETLGFEIGRSFYRGHDANFTAAIGWEKFDLAGDITGYTDGNTPFAKSDFYTDTTYAALAVEYAVTSKITAELGARWDFAHDDVMLTLNGTPAKLYEDIGFHASVKYHLNDNIGFGLYHEQSSELLSNTRIEFDYSF